MKILIGQPKQEQNIEQLSKAVIENPNVDMILFPEGYAASEELLPEVCRLCKEYRKIIVMGYKREGKHRALIINNSGEITLERAKTPLEGELFKPSVVEINGLKIGYLLCREILKGKEGMDDNVDLIVHPIGVGMFSDEQFDEWIGLAKEIAVKHKAVILGTSHADGVLQGYDISIPIAYCIDKDGKELFVSKADLRNRIVDFQTKEVEITENICREGYGDEYQKYNISTITEAAWASELGQ